jgi:acetamidase/formamidase
MFKDSKLLKFCGTTFLCAVAINSVLAGNSLSQSNTQQRSDNNTQSVESCFPFIAGPLNQADMIAPADSLISNPHKVYILAATPATTQWGYFDNRQPPVLTINSGDSVVIETLAAENNQVIPGLTIDKLAKISSAVPGRGPHTVTGPIYVKDAEPGDVLQIHFNKIVPKPYASNNSLPNKGLLPKEFPKGQVKYFYLDVAKNKMQFAPGIVIPLHPFPGLIAVGHAEPGKFNTDPPGRFGGNMDLRVMTAGTTLYLPVFTKGALIWTGDSHAGQGNGEIDLTAIETAFQEFNITVNLIKHQSLEWPRVETSKSWITVGYDKDLNKALEILKGETIKFWMEKNHLSKVEAEKKMYETWNCPISEVVNGVQGMYCIIPKKSNVSHPLALPTVDNAKFFVTVAKNADIEEAMRTASMAMINRIVTNKGLSAMDAYILASFTMDCRVSPYQSGDKEVHCVLPKNLWVSVNDEQTAARHAIRTQN